MRKPTISIGENKSADQLRGNREADQRLCFRYTDSTLFLFYLNPKFQASSSFMCLYRPVCVGPVRQPHCWFSHEAAHILEISLITHIQGEGYTSDREEEWGLSPLVPCVLSLCKIPCCHSKLIPKKC